MYYNSPTKTFHPNLQQESFHIPSLSSMYHLRTSQSSGTMSWEHPPISELCHGNMTIKHIHFNIFIHKFTSIYPSPFSHVACSFLSLDSQVPGLRGSSDTRFIAIAQLIGAFNSSKSSPRSRKKGKRMHPKNQIWSHLALGGKSWGAV